MKSVVLTKQEIDYATTIGILRNIESIKRGYDETKGGFKKGASHKDVHIQGALGEMAVAKLLKTYWPAGVNTFKRSDIGKTLQVKSTNSHGRQRLAVRDDDNLEHKYILVVDYRPKFFVVGWLYGTECVNPKWWSPLKQDEESTNKKPQKQTGSWFVPKEFLRPINDLILMYSKNPYQL